MLPSITLKGCDVARICRLAALKAKRLNRVNYQWRVDELVSIVCSVSLPTERNDNCDDDESSQGDRSTWGLTPC
jgi:hypothetical protein